MKQLTRNIGTILGRVLLFFVVSLISTAEGKAALNSDGVYEIGDYNDLSNFIKNYVKNNSQEYIRAKLTNDIDCKGKQALPPIGGWVDNTQQKKVLFDQSDAYNFVGEFDGGNHKITNLTIAVSLPSYLGVDVKNEINVNPTHIYFGFFGKTGRVGDEKSIIKDLTLENCTITASASSAVLYEGGIVAHAINTDITNCNIIGCTINESTGNETKRRIGTFCGVLSDESKMTMCKSSNTSIVGVASSGEDENPSKISGICGEVMTNSNIIGCYVTNGSLRGRGSSGLVGVINGGCKVSYSGFMGDFLLLGGSGGWNRSGCLCSEMKGGDIENSYSVVNFKNQVTYMKHSGIVVGVVSVADASIKNCYVVADGNFKKNDDSYAQSGILCGAKLNGVDLDTSKLYLQKNKNFINIPIKTEDDAEDVLANSKLDTAFMQSGCFAELLNKSVSGWKPTKFGLKANVKLWQEDMRETNKEYPVLAMQLGADAGDVVFCGPKIKTVHNAKHPYKKDDYDETTKLGGSITFLNIAGLEDIMDESKWEFGIEYTTGGKKTEYLYNESPLTYKRTAGSQIGNFEYKEAPVSGVSANYYRTYLRGPFIEGKVAQTKYGFTDTVYIGKELTILKDGCGIVEYNGKTYKKSEIIYDNKGEAVGQIVVLPNDTIPFEEDGKDVVVRCASNPSYMWEKNEETYYKDGLYYAEEKGMTAENGCKVYSELKLKLMKYDTISYVKEGATDDTFRVCMESNPEYIWEDLGETTSYTKDDIYVKKHEAKTLERGCDVYYKLNLKLMKYDTIPYIDPRAENMLPDNVLRVCGESYKWSGLAIDGEDKSYSDDGHYYKKHKTETQKRGCDVLYQLNLKLSKPNYLDTVYVVKPTDDTVKFVDNNGEKIAISVNDPYFSEYRTTKEDYKSYFKYSDNSLPQYWAKYDEHCDVNTASYKDNNGNYLKEVRKFWIANPVKMKEQVTKESCEPLKGKDFDFYEKGSPVEVEDNTVSSEYFTTLYERCDTLFKFYLAKPDSVRDSLVCAPYTYLNCNPSVDECDEQYNETKKFLIRNEIYDNIQTPGLVCHHRNYYINCIVGSKIDDVIPIDTCLKKGEQLTLKGMGNVDPSFIAADEVKVWSEGANVFDAVENNEKSCDGVAHYKYNVFVHYPNEVIKDTMHGVGSVVYPGEKINGEDVTITESQDRVFKYKVNASDVCMQERIVHFVVHKPASEPEKVSLVGCDSMPHVRLDNNETVWLKAGDADLTYTLKKRCEWENDSWDSVTVVVKPYITSAIRDTNYFNYCEPKYCVIKEDKNKKVYITKDTIIDVVKKEGDCTNIYTYIFTVGSSGEITAPTKYLCKGEVFTVPSGKRYITENGTVSDTIGTECLTITHYNVEFIEPEETVKDTVYACESYTYTAKNGLETEITSSQTWVENVMSAKNSTCVGEKIMTPIVIGHPYESATVKDLGTYCARYDFYSMQHNKIVSITESSSFSDTIQTKCGCDSITKYKVTITPVDIHYDTAQVCGKYETTDIAWIGEEKIYGYSCNLAGKGDSSVLALDVPFLIPSGTSDCFDTTYRHIVIHGVKETFRDAVKACDEYVYTTLGGDVKVIKSDTTIKDTLRSMTCDCDSLIHNFNVKIGVSTKGIGDGKPRTECDSVVFKFNLSGAEKVFKSSAAITDTFLNITGCDSIVDVQITVKRSETSYELMPLQEGLCGPREVLDDHGVVHTFERDTVWREVRANKTAEGCPMYKLWDVRVQPIPVRYDTIENCGSIKINADTYEAIDERVSFDLTPVKLGSGAPCDTLLHQHLILWPEYTDVKDSLSDCKSVTRNGKIYTESIDFVEHLKTVNYGCDSIVTVKIVVFNPKDVKEERDNCNILIIDGVEYTESQTITIHTVDEHNCPYDTIRVLKITPPVYGDTVTMNVRRDYWTNEALAELEFWNSRRKEMRTEKYTLTKDTMITRIAMSKDRCDSIFVVDIVINDPVMFTAKTIDSCMYITYMDSIFMGKDTLLVEKFTSTEDRKVRQRVPSINLRRYDEPIAIMDSVVTNYDAAVDSVYFTYLNVQKCFPYPVLVDKYGWILVCNDNIMGEDRFKWGEGAKYRWYKDDVMVSETTDNYYSESEALDGCYYVSVVASDGREYASDVLCFNSNRKFSIAPTIVKRGGDVKITLEFTNLDVKNTTYEVYNMMAMTVKSGKAESDMIVINTTNFSESTYFVKLVAEDGSVIVTKFVVK